MKFSVEKTDFLEHLEIVSRAINNKTTLPVLSNVLLQVKDQNVFLTTTNLEISIENTLSVIEAEDGEITVPVKLLVNYLQLLPEGNIKVVLEEKNTLSLKSKTSKTTIKGIESSEFPVIPKIKEDTKCMIPVQEAKDIFVQTVFASALDERRPVLAGVYLCLYKDSITTAASDSYRLAEKKVSVSSNIEKTSVIIPHKTVIELIRILTKTNDENIEVKISKNQIIFIIGSIILTSRLIEGMYPDYTKIIPENIEATVEVSVEECMTVVRRVNLFVSESSSAIKFLFKDNIIEVYSDMSQSGNEKAAINCEFNGEEKNLSLNANYLIDSLSHIQSDTVIIGLNTNLSPIVIRDPKDEKFTQIIMPLKV